jgi:hypothetical protein
MRDRNITRTSEDQCKLQKLQSGDLIAYKTRDGDQGDWVEGFRTSYVDGTVEVMLARRGVVPLHAITARRRRPGGGPDSGEVIFS